MLEATAKHPAMLTYLDNATSVSMDNDLAKRQKNSIAGQRIQQKEEEMMKDPNTNVFVKQALAGKSNRD